MLIRFLTRNRGSVLVKVGDLVKYKNAVSKKCGIVLERGDYAFACDVFIYWFSVGHARAERSGDLKLLTFA